LHNGFYPALFDMLGNGMAYDAVALPMQPTPGKETHIRLGFEQVQADITNLATNIEGATTSSEGEATYIDVPIEKMVSILTPAEATQGKGYLDTHGA
jgi:hypothetical protein